MDKLLMRRRSFLNNESAGPSKPYRYSIESWTKTVNGTEAALDNWNKASVSIASSYTSIGVFFNLFNGAHISGSAPGSSATYMTFPAGSSVTVKLTNISNPNSMSIGLYATEGGSSTRITSLDIARFTNSSDKSVTATINNDTTCGGLWLEVVRTGRVAGNSFACDLEVYVNGERWI